MSDNKYQYLRAANILHGSYYTVSGSSVITSVNDAYRRWAPVEDLEAGTYTFSQLALNYTVLVYGNGELHKLNEWNVNTSGGTIEVTEDFTLYASTIGNVVYTATMFVNSNTLPASYVEGLYEGESVPEEETVSETSILNTVKHGLDGIPEDYTVFDDTLIMHINGVFQRLFQLRIGPIDKPFKITGKSETWEEFLGGDTSVSADMEMVKSDMILRVRLLFDPPTSSYVIDNIQKLIQEYEWCMNTQVDSEDTYAEDEE